MWITSYIRSLVKNNFNNQTRIDSSTSCLLNKWITMADMNNESLLDASMEEKSDHDDSMNVSGRISVGSSTDDEEVMLQISTASFDFTRSNIELINNEFMDDDNNEGQKWGEGSQIGKAEYKARDFVETQQSNKMNIDGGRYMRREYHGNDM
jgi:hypothetical protein